MDLTVSAVQYLFASTWAPRDDSKWTLDVPGASVVAIDTAGNLLNLAFWSLREQGLMDFRQLRPAVAEPVMVMGGDPFAAFTVLDQTAELPGLEGALLRASSSYDGDQGVRGLVLSLGLHHRGPWNTVANHCFSEAHAAGLVEVKGRLFKRPVITDAAAVEALKPRNEEIAAARAAYRQTHADLDHAVIGDCLAAVTWAYGTAD